MYLRANVDIHALPLSFHEREISLINKTGYYQWIFIEETLIRKR